MNDRTHAYAWSVSPTLEDPLNATSVETNAFAGKPPDDARAAAKAAQDRARAQVKPAVELWFNQLPDYGGPVPSHGVHRNLKKAE